ncbi:MAG: hypothetical protein FWD98_03815 [Defluviitaleaceae bacterium]|nr:hypothetical protein [Defluviitaleaceae bacterium]
MNRRLLETAASHELRGYILKVAQEARPLGASLKLIESVLRQLQFDIEEYDVVNACGYLAGKGLVRITSVSNKTQGISRDIVHLTPEGEDVLDGTCVVDGVEVVEG